MDDEQLMQLLQGSHNLALTQLGKIEAVHSMLTALIGTLVQQFPQVAEPLVEHMNVMRVIGEQSLSEDVSLEQYGQVIGTIQDGIRKMSGN
jgi:hypothetical protein